MTSPSDGVCKYPQLKINEHFSATDSEAVDLGFARVDVGREARQGVPEVVYGTGKTAAQVVAIVRTLLRHNDGPVLVTRVTPDTAGVVLDAVPDGTYDSDARLLTWRPARPTAFTVVVAAAGTADLPVAREAAAIAAAVGLDVTSVTDVGVAGLHRLLAEQHRLRAADTVIVVAGMEGALASAIGGLVACPVVAVPTSTGYGAGLEGITALLAMHASCAAGITVVNIDSGFGAAMAAFRLSAVLRRSTP
ncbi:nickel pincer cofactor biosynthesis protein LarB [Lentzea sp. NPDC042327]|uniref:nickel pincer cofactor biosynthesis protein LarB n=1 Tax=Lentzea sp. NPDC042327 TaxID=3154801 RepID=UPI0033DC7588